MPALLPFLLDFIPERIPTMYLAPLNTVTITSPNISYIDRTQSYALSKVGGSRRTLVKAGRWLGFETQVGGYE
jgi:hypothetical protein